MPQGESGEAKISRAVSRVVICPKGFSLDVWAIVVAQTFFMGLYGGGCARKRKKDLAKPSPFRINGRRERIRTFDPLHPMQVRYQAALHADENAIVCQRNRGFGQIGTIF